MLAMFSRARGAEMTGLSSTKHHLAALIGFTLAALAPAQAEQPTSGQADAIRQSCRSDFMANCTGVQPGGKDALLCLKNNLAKLSPACKSAVSAAMPPAAGSSPAAAAASAEYKAPAVAAHPANGSQRAAAARDHLDDLRRRHQFAVPRPAAGWRADTRMPRCPRRAFGAGLLRRNQARQREITPSAAASPSAWPGHVGR